MRNFFRNRNVKSTALDSQREQDSQTTSSRNDDEAQPKGDTTQEKDAEKLQAEFEEAASRLEASAGSAGLEQDDLLLLYGLYKQATCGPCTSFRPSFFDLKGRSKW